MTDNPHKGHRQRLKNQYIKGGSECMTDFNFLELMLFYAIPQCDTNVIAHNLIEEFGSFEGVLEASYDELVKVKGIGANAATYLTLYLSAMKRYEKIRSFAIFSICDYNVIEEYIRSEYAHIDSERTMLMHFGANGDFINSTWIGEEITNCEKLDFKAISAQIIHNKSKMVILVRNHPTGFAIPSQEDKNVLLELSKLFRMINIELIDNVILSKDDILFFSMHEQYTEIMMECNNRSKV